MFDLGKIGRLSLTLIALAGFSQPLLAWYDAYKDANYSKTTSLKGVTANRDYQAYRIPVGFLNQQDTILQYNSDALPLRTNVYDLNNALHSANGLPATINSNTVVLDVLGDYFYIQVLDPTSKQQSLQRCTLTGCTILKNNAADPSAIQMGLPSHTLNQKGVLLTWYQDQSRSPRTNRLSFFDATGTERAVLVGDGYVTAIARTVNLNAGVNGIGSHNGKPFLARLKNNHTQWWNLPNLGDTELVPVAIDGNDNPRVILLENNKKYDGAIYACDINWSTEDDGSLVCVGGLRNLGTRAAFNLGWYLTDDGYLFANGITFEDTYYKGSVGALINTHTADAVRLNSVATLDYYGSVSTYYYTSIHGDIVFRSEKGRRSSFGMLEADKNQDSLGDGWTTLYPSTFNKPDGDEDEDGLINRYEYKFGSDPTRADADRDGLTDKQEYELRSNPYDRDTDSDGLLDADEVAMGSNINSADSDGDGFKDGNDDFPLDETQHVDYETDDDNDGIPNYFENNMYGIYANRHDSGDDLDSDGLTNLQEYNLGTLLDNSDSDDDGLPDAYEVIHDFNPLDISETSLGADADLDGWNNMLEYQAETDPNDANVYPTKGMVEWSIGGSVKGSSATRNAIGPNNTIYIPTSDKKIYSVAPNSTINWFVNTSLVNLTPVIAADGTIYVPDSSELKALNPDGSTRWTKSGRWKVSIGDNGSLYISGGNMLKAIDSDGNELWSTSISISGSKRPLVGINKIYIIAGKHVLAYSKKGELEWDYLSLDLILSSAIDVIDQSIVITGYSSRMEKLSSNGELIFNTYLESYRNTFSEIIFSPDKSVYIYKENSSQKIISFDEYGTKKWEKSISRAGSNPLVIGASGTIYLALNNKLIAYDSNGIELWQVNNVSGSPVIGSDNHIYMGGASIKIPLQDSGLVYWSQSGKDGANSNSLCNFKDIDCDGMPESYELENEFDITLNEGALDPDSDGLTNYQEFLAGTDPRFKDSDGDQIPDAYEVYHGLNPIIFDALDDLDGDGYDNITEYQDGTDVNDINATPLKETGNLRKSLASYFESVTMDDKGVLYGYLNNKITAIDQKGSVLWETSIGSLIQPIAMLDSERLIVIDSTGIKFLLSKDGSEDLRIDGAYSKVARIQNGILAVSYKTVHSFSLSGSKNWSSDVSYAIENIAVNANGYIYTNSKQKYVSALSPAGEFLWTNSFGTYLSPLAINSLGNVIISTSNYIRSYDITGTLKWSKYVSNTINYNYSPIISSDDIVYIVVFNSANNYSLIGFDLNGNWTSTVALPSKPGQITVDSSGRVFVPLRTKVGIYSAGVALQFINASEDNRYSAMPEITIANNRLVLNYGASSSGISKLDDLYVDNLQESGSWSSYGGGSHNGNSVCGLIDTDCDGLSDSYEISVGLDPDFKDTHLDKDQDGIINIRELQLGLDPLKSDTDNDGMDDKFELLNGLDYLSDDANLDKDIDGSSNIEEYLAGSDVNDPTASSVKVNGNKLWQRPVTNSEFIVDEYLTTYVLENNELVALDSYGVERWRVSAPIGNFRSLMMPSAHSLVAYTDKKLSIYSSNSGKLEWSVEGDINVVFASEQGRLHVMSDDRLIAYSLNGDEVWNRSLWRGYSAVIDSAGNIYAPSGSRIYAFNSSGHALWNYDVGDTVSPLALDNRENIMFTAGKYLNKINQEGNPVWQTYISGGSSITHTGPVLAFDGTTYLSKGNQYLVAVNSEGKELWNKSMDNRIYGGKSISLNGHVLYPSRNKIISVDNTGSASVIPLQSDFNVTTLKLSKGHFFVSDSTQISNLYSDNEGLAYSWSTKGGGNHMRQTRCGFSDSDCDALPDLYELDLGLNPNMKDTLLDADSDGLPNITELQLGTNLFNKDSDFDGIDDAYEVQFGLDPAVDDAHDDADQDGFTNIEEYLITSDLNDPMSTALKKVGAQQWKIAEDYTSSYTAMNDFQDTFIWGNNKVSRINKYGVKVWEFGRSFGSYLPILVNDENLLLHETPSDDLALYNALTGERIWYKNGKYSRPVVSDDGSIYTVLDGKYLQRISLSGELIWSVYSNGSRLLLNDSNQIILAGSRVLRSFNSEGVQGWSVSLPNKITGISRDIRGDIIASLNGGLSKISRIGAIVWDRSLQGRFNTGMTAMDGSIYVIKEDYNKYLEKFDRDGARIWSKTLSNVTGDIALGEDDKVYIPHNQKISVYNHDGTLVTINAQNTGDIKNIKLVKNSLFLATEKGYFRLYNNAEGQGIGWTVKYGGLHNRGGIFNSSDSDRDGLPDEYELSVNMNPNKHDLHDDPDGDGLSNVDELLIGTNPFKKDSDEDGIPDNYELDFSLNPLFNDSSLDKDQDGYSNLQEYEAGSNPQDATSTSLIEVGAARWHVDITKAKITVGENDVVYAWSAYRLTAMNWYGLKLWDIAVPRLQSEPVAIGDNKLVLPTDGSLTVINATTGKVEWSVAGDFVQSLLGANGNLYSLNSSGDLLIFDLNGNLLFSNGQSYESIIRMRNGTIIAKKGRYLYLLNEQAYKIANIRGSYDFSVPATSIKSEILVSSGGYLDKYSSQGALLWSNGSRSYSSATSAYSPLVDILGTSYTLFGSDLVAINPEGVELWSKRLSVKATASPVLTSDNRVIIPGYKSISIVSSTGEETVINIPNIGTINQVQIFKDKLLVAGNSQVISVYIGGEGESRGWSSLKGGAHNSSSLCTVNDLDCNGVEDSIAEAESSSPSSNADINNNGLPDWWEIKYFTDIEDFDLEFNAVDPMADYDSDGYSNKQEYMADTNPIESNDQKTSCSSC